MANISTYVGSGSGGSGSGSGGVTNAYESSQYYCIKSKCNISEGELVVVESGCNQARDVSGGVPGACLFEYGCNGFGQCTGQTGSAAIVEFYCTNERFATIDYRGAWCCGQYSTCEYDTGLVRVMAHCLDPTTRVITSSCIYECTFQVGPQGPAPACQQNWYCCFYQSPCCSNCAYWDWTGPSGTGINPISASSCSGSMAAVLNGYTCCFKRTSSPGCCVCERVLHETKLCYCTTTCEISVISVCCLDYTATSTCCYNIGYMLTNEEQPEYFVGMYRYVNNGCPCCSCMTICHIVQKLDDTMCLLCHTGAGRASGMCPRSVFEATNCCNYPRMQTQLNAPGIMPFTQGTDGWILNGFLTNQQNCQTPCCLYYVNYWAWKPTANQCYEYTTNFVRECDIPCLPWYRCTCSGNIIGGAGCDWACGQGEAGRAWDDGNGVKRLLMRHCASNSNYTCDNCACAWFVYALTCFCVDPTSKCLCQLGTDALGCVCACAGCNCAQCPHSVNTPRTYINAWACRSGCGVCVGFSGTFRTDLRGVSGTLSCYDGKLYEFSRTICRDTACYAGMMSAAKLFGTLCHECANDLFNRNCNDCVKSGGYIELGTNCCAYAFMKFYKWCANSTCFNANCNPSVVSLDSSTADYRFATSIMFNHPIGRGVEIANGYVGSLAPAICANGCGYAGICTSCATNACRKYDQCLYQVRCDWEEVADNTGFILGIAQNTATPGDTICVAVPGTIDKTCFTKCYVIPNITKGNSVIGECGCTLKTTCGCYGTPLLCYVGAEPEGGSAPEPCLHYHTTRCQNGCVTCTARQFYITPYWDVADSDYYGAITKCGCNDPSLPQF